MNFCLKIQECIPVGCVLPTSVVVSNGEMCASSPHPLVNRMTQTGVKTLPSLLWVAIKQRQKINQNGIISEQTKLASVCTGKYVMFYVHMSVYMFEYGR